MIVDTSALIAVLFKEPDWRLYFDTILASPTRSMAAPNWLEACLVFDNRDNQYVTRRLEQVVQKMGIRIVPFDETMAEVARFAHRRYGRRNHLAKLNFGDCIAYAASKVTGEPLLFKGNDFPQTDITPLLP